MSILRKCLTELEAETPRLDYIRGMLEVLYDMEQTNANKGQVLPGATRSYVPPAPTNEIKIDTLVPISAKIFDVPDVNPAKLKNVQELAAQSLG